MRVSALLPTIFIASAAASAALAQTPQVTRVGPGTIVGPGMYRVFGDEPRAVIGVSTTSNSTSRDTLGVLVATVRSGSPAEKAGIEEGNRIASINGVSLKLAAADVGDDQMAGALSRRLARELDKLRPGDDVDLTVVANGQTKSIKVKTIAPEDMSDTRTSRRVDDRPTLGLNVASNGSNRDTIGVFVMGVEDTGPAAKAGIEEGSRIASINGVDLKSRKYDDDDLVIRRSNVNRLTDEVSRLKPGDVADLRVYYNGQYKSVKVTVAKMSDLPRSNRTIRIIGGDNFRMSPMDNFDLNIDGAEIGNTVRRAIGEARIGTNRGLESLGRTLSRIGGRVNW
ncbi:MAG: PDZ domain-containing protein [Gemmatimonadaceae bacterium]